ncbi:MULTISPECIES: helix-turn-helix transcriptional regulator [unclassified Leucobacter]|uniref:ArsR/SmtB family transcription factor n=1 Tax=unclassified Leucobacter TaxID=2621730 RepID=UPI0009DA1340|nr:MULTISPECIES: metalloregulator ArsR/SmtB family transcription factor [unclassified Leucobacter]RGE16849.1 ArsR family transcriptional regulator [Leucobacter sp. wl10]
MLPYPKSNEPAPGAPLDRAIAEELARSLRAVADPTRLQILSSIINSEQGCLTVGQLAQVLGLRQPTVTHHVHILVADGYLVRRPEGKVIRLSVPKERRASVEDLLR